MSVSLEGEEPVGIESEANPQVPYALLGAQGSEAVRPHLAGREKPQDVGIFRLCLNMLIHPLRTSDELVSSLGTPPMLIKAMVLFVSGLVVAMLPGLPILQGRSGSASGLVAFVALVVGLMFAAALSALFVAVLAWLFIGKFEYLATLVGFCFVEGLVHWATVGLRFAVPTGVIAYPGLIAIAWTVALKLLVIYAIFDVRIATFLVSLCFLALQLTQLLFLLSIFGAAVGTSPLILCTFMLLAGGSLLRLLTEAGLLEARR